MKWGTAEMIYNKEFDLQEAVILLDCYISAKERGQSDYAAAAAASAKLRRLARARGQEISEGFRSAKGIEGRLRKLVPIYKGTAPDPGAGTPIFREAVALLRNDPAAFGRILKGAENELKEPVKIEPIAIRPAKTKSEKMATNKTKFVHTDKDQTLRNVYGDDFRSVYYYLKRETDGKDSRLTSTDIFIGLDRRVMRRVVAEILEGASWAKKVDSTPRYIFFDAEREEKRARELEDKINAAERDFLSWLPSAVAPAELEDTRQTFRLICMMLQQKKFLPQSLITTAQVGQIDNAIRQVQRSIANKRLRHRALRLLNAYATYMREKKKSPLVTPAEPNVDVKENWIRFDFSNAQQFARTIPVYCSIDGDELSERNWARILCAIVEREIKKDTPALKELYKRPLLASRDDSPFFLKNRIEGLNCKQLSNGAWINVNYSIPRLMEIIRGFCLHCGYAKNRVTIYGAPRYSAPGMEDEHPSAASGNAVHEVKALVYLKGVGLKGASAEEIIASEQPSAAVFPTRKMLDEHANVVAMPGNRYIHAECFYDLEEAQACIASILKGHFRQFGGYSNSQLLYGAAVNDLSLFLDDNGCDNIDAVYAVARYLFGKKAAAGHPYVFSSPHIFERAPDFPTTSKGLMIHLARLNGGILLAEAAKAFLQKTQLNNPGLNSLLQISSDDSFIMYDGERYLLKEALGIDAQWIQAMHTALDDLFSQANVAFVVPRDIRDVWLKGLPSIPQGLPWTLLMLQEILRKVPEIGFKPIVAELQQSLGTIAAAIVPSNSQLQTFPDVVTLYMQEKYELPRRMSSEELRIELRDAGMLEGNQMIFSLHKALADYRFAWSSENRMVLVRGN